jgi:glyoxylase-like metal-dependent hydrolase (beta-lactamase superfamily II)
MNRWVVRGIRWIVALAVAGAAALALYVYWSFYDNRMPRDGSFPLDISELRASASAVAGPKADHIEFETLSHTPVPEIAMVAGTSWHKIDMVRNSYRVVFPGQSLLIDTGHSREDAQRYGAAEYDDGAWARVLDAIDEADIILLTHGHGDHAGGLLARADNETARANARLSQPQIETMRSGGLAAEAFEASLDNTGLRAIAPGVVIIPAPGHTPGSQLIYVQLSNGREYVFMGDTASLGDNVRLGRIRSHYVTDKIGSDDRLQVFRQTAALQKLSRDVPEIILIPGHDGAATTGLERQGILTRGFTHAEPRP